MSVSGRRIGREMGLSHGEFLRTLPEVLGTVPQPVDGVIAVASGGKRLTIRLAPETRRRLGALTLPVTRVELAFDGYTEEETARFLERFERAYHRAGG